MTVGREWGVEELSAEMKNRMNDNAGDEGTDHFGATKLGIGEVECLKLWLVVVSTDEHL
jgi:hypothetical protein